MKNFLRTISIIMILIFVFSATSLAASSVPAPVMKSAKSVVRVITESISQWSSGSGFIIGTKDGNTLVATNYHVIEGSPHKIYIYDGEGNEISGSVLVFSKQKDFAVIQLNQKIDQQPLLLCENGAKQGDAVYAVGFPADADVLSNTMAQTNKEVTITDGIVSSIHSLSAKGYGESVSILQINADINHGNSGGPLFNKSGEVVGINTYGVSAGINGAISVQDFIAFLKANNIPYNQTSPLIVVLVGIILTFAVAAFLFFRKKMPNKKKIDVSKLNPLSRNKMSLEDYVSRNGPLGVTHAVSLLMPVFTSVRDMHNNGNMHLEISPKRIYINSKGASVIHPKHIEENRYNNGFAAPEIYSAANIGTGSDIYSLCAVLYYATTGIIPQNALSRSKNTTLDFSSIQTDKDFVNLIKKGLSLDIKSRQRTSQEVVDQLIVFNTELPSNNSNLLSEKNPVKTAKVVAEKSNIKKPLSKKGKVILWSCGSLILIILLLLGPTLLTLLSINSKNFEMAEKTLKIPGLTKSLYPGLDQYINAGKLYNKGLYDSAWREFINWERNYELKQFTSLPDMTSESKYQYAIECEEKGELYNALVAYDLLGNYKDSEERVIDIAIDRIIQYINTHKSFDTSVDAINELIFMHKSQNIKGALYQVAQNKIEEEDYICAYVILSSISDYSDSREILPYLKDNVYSEAISMYRSGEECTDLFNFLNGYENSRDYALLSTIKQNRRKGIYDSLNLSSSEFDRLFDLVGFEDANEIIMKKYETASRFLEGNWRSSDGHYIKLNSNGSISYDLPWFDYGNGGFSIKDGKVILYKTVSFKDYKPLFDISIINKNTIKVYCYKNSSVYTLYRQ